MRESRPAEDHPAALVAGTAELCLFDGHETSRDTDRSEAYSPIL
jgi:hypothetical protein